MIAVRLVVLALLVFIAWLLLRNLGGRKKTVAGGSSEKGNSQQQDAKVQDILVEDPVCHTLVPKNQAIRLRRDGTIHYFCSDACCDKFAGEARGEQ